MTNNATYYFGRRGLFPNYLGVLVALSVAGCGLLLVRRVIRLMAEFDKMQEPQLDERETTIAGRRVFSTTKKPNKLSEYHPNTEETKI